MPSQLLIGSKSSATWSLPSRDLKIHEKRKIKTSIQFKNLSKITSNNSSSRFNNSLKNFDKTSNACHLLYQLSFYKTSWRFHQGWPKKNAFKDVSDVLCYRDGSILLLNQRINSSIVNQTQVITISQHVSQEYWGAVRMIRFLNCVTNDKKRC